MTEYDTIVGLLAAGGAYTLGIAMMQAGLLEKGGGIPVPRIRRDPVHVAVVELGDDEEPRRLVYDDVFGWGWYNSEGPEEES